MMIRTGESGESPIRASAMRRSPPRPVKAQPGSIVATMPPEGIHPDAGSQESLPVPGGTADQVALGKRIFHGEVSTGLAPVARIRCRGSPIGADLTSGTWLGAAAVFLAGSQSISEGVLTPKRHFGGMPPMGASAVRSD